MKPVFMLQQQLELHVFSAYVVFVFPQSFPLQQSFAEMLLQVQIVLRVLQNEPGERIISKTMETSCAA